MKKSMFLYLFALLVVGVFAQETERVTYSQEATRNSNNFVELSWYFLPNTLTYTTRVFNNDETNEFKIPVYGALIEVFWGTTIAPFDHLKFGIAPSVYILGAENKLNFTEKNKDSWKADGDSLSLGFSLLAKYALAWDIAKIQTSFENGIGLGYFIHSFTVHWRDSKDDEDSSKSVEEAIPGMLLPVFDLAIKAKYNLNASSFLGLGFGINTIFMVGDQFELPIIFKAGLNYGIRF